MFCLQRRENRLISSSMIFISGRILPYNRASDRLGSSGDEEYNQGQTSLETSFRIMRRS
jgi:hypothetical protein